MKFIKIKIEDKNLFDNYFAKYQPEVSELTFTNIFCWRESREYKFCEHDGHLLISFQENGEQKLFQPIGPDPVKIISELIKEGFSFERVEEKIAFSFENRVEVEEMFDYVYSIKNLIGLPGRKYQAKRNFIKRFMVNTPIVKRLKEEMVGECLKLQEEWCNLRNCEDSLLEEDKAIKQLMKHRFELDVIGVVVLVKGKICAFAIGEKLNDNTFVDHFEKAMDVVGIYQFLLNSFAKIIPDEFEFLNREQDLGIEGLRRAKRSYKPVKMIKKFRISS